VNFVYDGSVHGQHCPSWTFLPYLNCQFGSLPTSPALISSPDAFGGLGGLLCRPRVARFWLSSLSMLLLGLGLGTPGSRFRLCVPPSARLPWDPNSFSRAVVIHANQTGRTSLCFFLRFTDWNISGTGGFLPRPRVLRLATEVGCPRMVVNGENSAGFVVLSSLKSRSLICL